MTTLVGTQSSFNSAIKDLIELEYDAIESYEAAVNRLTDQNYKNKMIFFMDQHKQRVKELSDLCINHAEVPPTGPSVGKQWVTKGKVVVGSLLGDNMILRALRSNEIDTNTAYDRMDEYEDIWPDAVALIKRGKLEERAHKAWLEATLDL